MRFQLMYLKHDDIPDGGGGGNHHLKVRCSFIVIKYCEQAETNSQAMVSHEAESLHHMRNG